MQKIFNFLNTKNVFVVSVVAGWIMMGIWSVTTLFTSNSMGDCSALARFNLQESRYALWFLIVIIFLFILSSFLLYRNTLSIGQSLSGWSIKMLLVLPVFLALCAPPFNTHDISFYFSAGSAVSRGVNVYNEEWRMNNLFYCPTTGGNTTGIMYGPLATTAFGAVYQLSQGNPLLFIMIFKLLALGGLFLVGYMGWYLLKKECPEAVKKSWAVLWVAQPFILWHWVGNGQFDAWWLACVFGAMIMAVRKQWWLVMVLLVIGTWIKFIPLLLTPWFVLWWWQTLTRATWKRSVVQLCVGLGLVGMITYWAWLPYWRGASTLQPIIMQTKWAVTSVFAVVYYSLKPVASAVFGANAHWILTRMVHAGLMFIIVYLLWPLAKQAWSIIRHKQVWTVVEYSNAVFVSMLVYLSIWQKSFWPWYVAWILPVGLLVYQVSSSEFIKKILRWLSAVPLLFYIIWIINHQVRGTDAPSELWFYWVIVVLVWIVPLRYLVAWRKKDYSLDRV